MNYQNIYDTLMNRAKERILEGYKEQHHIVPRCLGGNDKSSNLVYLTAREHYIAHQLLIKIYPKSSQLLYAAKMMVVSSPNQDRSYNRMYEWLKQRKLSHGKGTKNSQFGTCWVTKFAQRKSIKIKKEELENYLDDGWQKGRITRFDLNEREKKALTDIKNGMSIYKACKIHNLSIAKSTYVRFNMILDGSTHGRKRS